MRQTTMPRLRPLLIVIAALAVWPSAALAVDPTLSLLRECQGNTITGTYTQREYADALKSIPTDGDEYTACRDAIRRAQLAAARGPVGSASGGNSGGVGTGGGGGTNRPSSAGGTAQQLLDTATPAERTAIGDAAGTTAPAPVTVGGRRLSPTPSGLAPGGAANTLPVPLIVALALLTLGLLVALCAAARTQLVPTIRGARARVDARRTRSA